MIFARHTRTGRVVHLPHANGITSGLRKCILAVWKKGNPKVTRACTEYTIPNGYSSCSRPFSHNPWDGHAHVQSTVHGASLFSSTHRSVTVKLRMAFWISGGERETGGAPNRIEYICSFSLSLFLKKSWVDCTAWSSS